MGERCWMCQCEKHAPGSACVVGRCEQAEAKVAALEADNAAEIRTRQAAQARVIALEARLAEVAPVVEAACRTPLDLERLHIDDHADLLDAVRALRAARAKRDGGGA